MSGWSILYAGYNRPGAEAGNIRGIYNRPRLQGIIHFLVGIAMEMDSNLTAKLPRSRSRSHIIHLKVPILSPGNAACRGSSLMRHSRKAAQES